MGCRMVSAWSAGGGDVKEALGSGIGPEVEGLGEISPWASLTS